MSLNIKADPGFSFKDGWLESKAARKDRAINVIRSRNPDVLCVQELLLNQFLDLTAGLAEYGRYGAAREEKKILESEWNAIFYKADRFSLLDAGRFWLSETPDKSGSTFGGSDFPRIVVYALLYDWHSRQLMGAFCTHWSIEPDVRLKSAMMLRQRIAAIAPFAPNIVMGDFNMREGDPVYQALLAFTNLTDSYRFLHQGSRANEGTIHGFTGERTGGRIDYIFLSEHFDPVESWIIHRSYNKKYPSDHFPVAAKAVLSSNRAWLGRALDLRDFDPAPALPALINEELDTLLFPNL